MLTYNISLTDGLETEIKLHEYPMPDGMVKEAKLRIFLTGEPRPVMCTITAYEKDAIRDTVLEYLENAVVDLTTAKAFLDIHLVAASPINAPWKQKTIRKIWNDVLELNGKMRFAVFQSGPDKPYVAVLYGDGNRILFQEDLQVVNRNPALNKAVRRLVPYLENAKKQYKAALDRLRWENPFQTY